MATFDAWVGGREVLASGIFAVGPKDHYCSAKIGENGLGLFFIHSEADPLANHDFPSPNLLRITITGKLTPAGAWWELPNVAVWDEKFVHVTLMLRALTEPQIYREIVYTVTHSDAPL